MTDPVGIFGGTFDPPHHGHLRTALELYQQLGLAEMRLIPCREPPHRTAPATSAAQRLAMLAHAVGDTPGLVIDERELHRPGPSYMVDTLVSLRDELGDTPLCLVVGYDAFVKFDTWHRWRDIPALAHLIVVQRPGAPTALQGELAEQFARRRSTDFDALRAQPAGRIFEQAVTPMDISATRIRTLVAAGRSVRYLLSDGVDRYIQEHGLYQSVL
jgi:nicotinate-nucleotide adenylyltransferase